jgi:hypothetical protein
MQARSDHRNGVFCRTEALDRWQKSVIAAEDLPQQHATSFFLYQDKVTRIEKVFVETRVPDG